ECLIVQKRQRLQRRVGAYAARASAGAVGSIEDDQGRVGGRALEERVNAAAVPLASAARAPGALHLRELVEAIRLRRIDAGPARLPAQEAADRQSVVADDLGV